MLSKLTKPVTFHVRNALKQQAQKAGQKRRTRENFENGLEEKVFGAPGAQEARNGSWDADPKKTRTQRHR